MTKKIPLKPTLLVGFSTLVIFTVLYLLFWQEKTKHPADEVVYEPVLRYGIRVDSLLQFDGVVKQDETLSVLLQRCNVDVRTINSLVVKASIVFDARMIRAGNSYTLMCRRDSVNTPLYFIYEDTPSKYIVFSLGDSLHVYSADKEVERRIEFASGVIESSLWNALDDQGINPTLALELSDVYAWAIDFFAIQKGDSFRTYYEQIYVEGKPLKTGRVVSACFNHAGSDFYSFYFVQEGVGDYFDEEGKSLRKAFLKAPLKFSRISSRYSNSRLHPVLRIRRPHHGVDYAAPTGTPVMTIGDGTVTKAHHSGGAGKMVEIRHNSTYKTQYLHLSGYAKGINSGARVKQGQVIGYVGSTGLSTGPHLDFRVYKNGVAINPLKIESPPSEPVKDKYKEEFLGIMNEEKNKLDNPIKKNPEEL